MAAIPTSQKQFETISDLKLQTGTQSVLVNVAGLLAVNDSNGGWYTWMPSSTASDDGFTVIQVSGVTTGRWIRQLNPNTIKGSKTLSGLTLTTAYPITFDNPLPAIPAMVIIQAESAGAAVASWVSNKSTTGFTANFATVPIIGTLNLVITYLVIKQ